MNKLVSKTLEKISKARDILEIEDFTKVKENMIFFDTLKNDIIRQIKKYIEVETHTLDFNSDDVRAIADGLLDLENKVIKVRYSNLYKTINKHEPIQIEHFNELCLKIADRFYFDKFIRQTANELSFFSLVLWLWSESDYKKDLMSQITDHMKSFL